MELTPFHLQVTENLTVAGECVGNETSGRVVIFSHGFGVRRDSRGMFTQLGSVLESDFLVVRFDYDSIDQERKKNFVHPYHVQTIILDKVIAFISQTFFHPEINIVAHSQGCFIVGLAQLPHIHRVILNSSPTASPYERVVERLQQRNPTGYKQSGVNVFPRSDGSTTYFDAEFWPEMKAIRPTELYTQLANITDLWFIRALNDEIVTDGQYDALRRNANLHYLEIPGNHNFSDDGDRKNWLVTIKSILQ